jgi:predicted aminopeptidase
MKYLILSSLLFLTGCQLPYYLRNAYGQVEILWARQDLQKALLREDLSAEEKEKILLVQDVRQFAKEKFNLNTEKNYGSFVQLDRPFVTYVVNASEPWALKAYEWDYLIVGRMPYKGFFQEELAKKEKLQLEKKGLDVYLRGVTAYSTLGWFRDPILSSMLRGKPHKLVNLIIHESVHATLYIKNSADFNEQLATFIGNKGTEIYYLEKEGPNSKTVQLIQDENHDDHLFSEFISGEIAALKKWYSLYQGPKQSSVKSQRLKEIQVRFSQNVQPRLKTASYLHFSEIELNNARLSLYKTYMNDHSQFEALYEKVGRNMQEFLRQIQKLEDSKDPAKALKEMLNQ